jgi:plastocyanin
MWRAFGAATGALGAVATLVAACGGGSGNSNPSPPPLVVAKAPTASGDLQTGPISQPLPEDLRVLVTRDGNPESSVSVTWSTTSGSLSPTSSVSDGSGLAASTWTLGATGGAQTAQAAVQGATGSPVTFNATATGGGPPPPPPPNTISVLVRNINFTSARNATVNPAVDTVAIGGTVTWTWTNTGATTHSVQSTGVTSFTSSAQLMGNNQTHQFNFTAAGTYTYNCSIHGNQMTGRIVVR